VTAAPTAAAQIGTTVNYTVSAIGANSATVSATGSFTTAAAAASTSTVEVMAENMEPASTQSVTVSVKDSAGRPVQDGTSVTLVATGGAIVSSSAQTANGVATFTYVSPGTPQTVNLTAVVGTVNGSKAITVATGASPAPAGDGSLTTPSFGTGNVGSAVFAGGTIEQLAAQVTAAGGTSVWVQGADGNWYRYNTLASGATAFVNNAFTAQFEAGIGNVAVFVVK